MQLVGRAPPWRAPPTVRAERRRPAAGSARPAPGRPSASRARSASRRARRPGTSAPGPRPRALLRRRRVTSMPSKTIRPRSGVGEAGDDLEQRRLAGAVRADDAEDLATADVEAHAVRRRPRRRSARTALHGQDRAAGLPRTGSRRPGAQALEAVLGVQRRARRGRGRRGRRRAARGAGRCRAARQHVVEAVAARPGRRRDRPAAAPRRAARRGPAPPGRACREAGQGRQADDDQRADERARAARSGRRRR